MRTSRHSLFALALALALLGLAACGETGAAYRPIVDGPQTAALESDLAACQDLARERPYLNDDAKNDGLLGGAVGGAVGGASEGVEGAVAGVIFGAAIGAGGRAYETIEERKEIVQRCMLARGYRVVG